MPRQDAIGTKIFSVAADIALFASLLPRFTGIVYGLSRIAAAITHDIGQMSYQRALSRCRGSGSWPSAAASSPGSAPT